MVLLMFLLRVCRRDNHPFYKLAYCFLPDKATNKDQSMTIASSSGLSDKDIETMIADAEQFAETDKTRKNIIEESNKATSVCADTEKGLLCLLSKIK